jgi:hypothetical protein
MMDAKKILRSSLWAIVPLAVFVLVYAIVSCVGESSVDSSKKFADATIGEVGSLLLIHAILLAMLVRK